MSHEIYKNYDSFIKDFSLSWDDIIYGFRNNYINWHSLKDFAMERVVNGSNCSLDIEMAGLNESDLILAQDVINRISEKSISNREQLHAPKDIWLYLILSNLYERRHEFLDSLAEVEKVYADFEYPKEIESFIRYMPPSDGISLLSDSYEDNISQLYKKWNDYLENGKFKYLKKSKIVKSHV